MSKAALIPSISTPADLAWAADRIGVSVWPGDSKGISVRSGEGGPLRAVVVYNCFFDASCSAHIASDGERSWATRGILATLFHYPFVQIGLRRITLPIASKNRAAIILGVKLGFKFEGLLRDAREDDHEVIMGMTRSECEWLAEAAHG